MQSHLTPSWDLKGKCQIMEADESGYWVYILHCSNNTYYTGYTNNLERRYQAHKNGTAKCKYTRSFRPIAIAQSWKIPGDRALAMKTERAIKALSRVEKEKIIMEPACLLIIAPFLISISLSKVPKLKL